MIEITVSLPKKQFAAKKWLDKIASAQKRESVKHLRKLFNQTVFGWSDKPSMGWSQTKTADEITLKIYATGSKSDIWNLLNAGSPAHTIRPRKVGGFLRFRPGYRAATTPGSLQSRRAYRSGPVLSPVWEVKHPGFEARRFTELIAEQFAVQFGSDIQKAVTEAAKG